MIGADVRGPDPACITADGGPSAISGPAVDEGIRSGFGSSSARVQKGTRDGVAVEWRGSQDAMPMSLARVQTEVAYGARLWSETRDSAAGPAR